MASSSSSEIQLLCKSAAFAMSLGAKELFHTNFLAFLLGSDDPTLAPIQLAIRKALNFCPIAPAVPQCAVWREKSRLDLVVIELKPAPAAASPKGGAASDEEDCGGQTVGVPDGWDWDPTKGWSQSAGTSTSQFAAAAAVAAAASAMGPGFIPTDRALIVEAKLKSIPCLDQLNKYDNKLASPGVKFEFPEGAAVPDRSIHIGGASEVSTDRRLLSVTGVSMPTTAPGAPAASGQWVGVTWKSLQIEMSGATGTLAGSPLHHTVTDYTEALGALVALTDRVHQICVDAHLPGAQLPTYGAMRLQPLDPQFKSLRISDLLGKVLFGHWLQSYVPKPVPGSIHFGWTLKGSVGFSRGTPSLVLELGNDKFSEPGGKVIDLRIGVEIQDCEFRLFVEVDVGWGGLEAWIAGHQLLLPDWFSAPVFRVTPTGYRRAAPKKLAGPGRPTNLKVFNANRFLYSSLNIDNQLVVDVERELARVIALAASLAPSL